MVKFQTSYMKPTVNQIRAGTGYISLIGQTKEYT